jgi:spore germination protein YaaH
MSKNKSYTTVLLALFCLFSLNLVFVPAAASAASKRFAFQGWIAYWKKNEGVASAIRHIDRFTALSPFAYSVKSDGTLVDTMKIGEKPWPELVALARSKNIAIIPSIMWGSKTGIHHVLSNPKRRAKHVAAIVATVKAANWDGIDIDYEGKDGKDKEAYSRFITELATALHKHGKSLSCTIEARTGDRPEIKQNRVFGGAWANDYTVLNKYCDEVRLMAYDQPFPYELPELAKYQPKDPNVPYTPVADTKWVADVIKYTISKIDKNKVVVGIPTYGRQFIVTGKPGNWRYKRNGGLNLTTAVAMAAEISATPKRSVWGEMIYEFKSGGIHKIVVFQDKQSIQDKIDLAKRFGIKGVIFFKLDGTEENLIY